MSLPANQLNQVGGGLCYLPHYSCFVSRGKVAETKGKWQKRTVTRYWLYFPTDVFLGRLCLVWVFSVWSALMCNVVKEGVLAPHINRPIQNNTDRFGGNTYILILQMNCNLITHKVTTIQKAFNRPIWFSNLPTVRGHRMWHILRTKG